MARKSGTALNGAVERVKLVMEKLESVCEIIDRRNKKSVMSKVLSTVGLFSLSLIVKDSFPK
jgi:hypothetical protein